MNVQEVLNSQDGALVMGLEGTITKSWPRTQAGNGHFQNFVLADDNGQEITIKAWDHDAHFEPGMRVRVSARQNNKKQWGGTARESYHGKVRVAVKRYALEILGQSNGQQAMPSQPNSGAMQPGGHAPSNAAPPWRRPDPVFPGEHPEQFTLVQRAEYGEREWQATKERCEEERVQEAFRSGVSAGKAARTSPAALTKAEVRENIVDSFDAFLRLLGYDFSQGHTYDIVPPHILEVAAGWATHESIGIQQGKIQRDAEQDGGQ